MNPKTRAIRPVLLGLVAALALAAVGSWVATLNVNAERSAGIRGEALLGFSERFSWWLAGAASAFAYVVLGAYILRVRSGVANPLLRAVLLVGTFLLGAICPVAVAAAIEATKARHPGFVCILPGIVLLWSPWALSITALIVNVTLDRRGNEKAEAHANAH
jgi:hypothetical protein